MPCPSGKVSAIAGSAHSIHSALRSLPASKVASAAASSSGSTCSALETKASRTCANAPPLATSRALSSTALPRVARVPSKISGV